MVEVFDDAGWAGRGVLAFAGDSGVIVRVDRIQEPESEARRIHLTVAAAVPKGDRADWMVEKLSELGVAEFVPLAAARSVVLPEGKNKRERWLRIATEAAKQSRRAGVLQIAELTPLADAVRAASAGELWYLATEPEATPLPIASAIQLLPASAALTAFVGPEGGWTAEELRLFASVGGQAVRLTDTVLRVETAAIALAAITGCLAEPTRPAGEA